MIVVRLTLDSHLLLAEIWFILLMPCSYCLCSWLTVGKTKLCSKHTQFIEMCNIMPQRSQFPVACTRSNLKRVCFLWPSPGGYGVIELQWRLKNHFETFDCCHKSWIKEDILQISSHKDAVTAPSSLLLLLGKVQCTFSGALQFERDRSCRGCRVSCQSVVFALLMDHSTTLSFWRKILDPL